MAGYDDLLAIAANPRGTQVHVECACGKQTPVGLPDEAAGLPVHCNHCGSALDDRAVLLANLQLARAETVELAKAVGLALAALASVDSSQPHTRHAPLETMRRTIDMIAGDSGLPSIAALAAAVMRR